MTKKIDLFQTYESLWNVFQLLFTLIILIPIKKRNSIDDTKFKLNPNKKQDMDKKLCQHVGQKQLRVRKSVIHRLDSTSPGLPSAIFKIGRTP